MRRRTMMTAAGAGLVSLAGCLADAPGEGTETAEDGESRRYEECSREVIPHEQFPEDVQAEIDAALDGRYEAGRVYLQEAMDTTESYVSVDSTYYDPNVAVETDREVLELHRVEPKALPNPRPVSVEQERDGERTITVVVTADDGTVLIEETKSLWPGGDVEFGRTARVGTHDVRITVEDGDTVEDDVTETVRIDESWFELLVVVDPDEISLSGTVAELGICRYEA